MRFCLMSRRFWIRLAGCIAIERALAANPDYQAGMAAVEYARAVAIEDNRGSRAVFAQADFPVTRAVSDFVGAQLAKDHGLDRASLMIYAKPGLEQPANPEALLTAITGALGTLEPASVRFDGTTISILADARCIAALPAGACAGGTRVRPPIRAAFQMIEAQRGLQARGEVRESYPVQAISLGKEAAILGLGGDARYPATRRLVVIPFANDTAPPPAGSVVEAGARRVLSLVGR
jgi:hypothetical protein